MHCRSHLRTTRGVVIFAHSVKARAVYNRIKRRLTQANVPTLVLHGNGHKFHSRSFRNRLLRIQVDRGGIAPPLKVTVKDTNEEDHDDTFAFSNMFHIYRQRPE